MTKIIGFVAGASLFLVAGVAGAASITNIEFSNGDVTYQGKGGTTVNAEFRITVPSGEVVEQFEVDVIGDSLAPRCETVGGSKGLEEGTHFVKRSIKLPPNTGEYDVDVRTAGIFGGTRAIDCDDNNNGSDSFSDAVRVVGSNVDDNDDDFGGSDDEDFWDKVAGMIAAALKAAGVGEKPAEPAKPAFCASFVVHNGMNTTAVQGWLATNGFMTWEAVSTGPGIFGPKTTAAYGMAAAQCN